MKECMDQNGSNAFKTPHNRINEMKISELINFNLELHRTQLQRLHVSLIIGSSNILILLFYYVVVFRTFEFFEYYDFLEVV